MTIEFDLERRLRDFLAPLAEEAGHEMTDQPWISGFAGWRFREPATPALIAALNAAHPMPGNLAAAWAEYRHWQDLSQERPEPHISARMAGLEHLMDTSRMRRPRALLRDWSGFPISRASTTIGRMLKMPGWRRDWLPISMSLRPLSNLRSLKNRHQSASKDGHKLTAALRSCPF